MIHRSCLLHNVDHGHGHWEAKELNDLDRVKHAVSRVNAGADGSEPKTHVELTAYFTSSKWFLVLTVLMNEIFNYLYIKHDLSCFLERILIHRFDPHRRSVVKYTISISLPGTELCGSLGSSSTLHLVLWFVLWFLSPWLWFYMWRYIFCYQDIVYQHRMYVYLASISHQATINEFRWPVVGGVNHIKEPNQAGWIRFRKLV